MNDKKNDLQIKLKSLSKKIESEKKRHQIEDRPSRNTSNKGMAIGLKYVAEFVSAIIVGVAIGFFIGKISGANTWSITICSIFGFAAGILNLIRARKEEKNKSIPSNDPFE